MTDKPDLKTPERAPVVSLMCLATLRPMPEAEAIEAYEDGRNGWPCGDNRDRAYWHAWRQGAADGGHRQHDVYDRILAGEVSKIGLLNLERRIDEVRALIAIERAAGV